jgi:hypothetical protein
MSDCKTDQDRFFDNLRDIPDFREATESRRAAEMKSAIDGLVGHHLKTPVGSRLPPSQAPEIREKYIAALKSLGKLPGNYSYPTDQSH